MIKVSFEPITSSPEFRGLIEDFLRWRKNRGDHFNHKLFDLFMKADGGNLHRLTLGFPVHGYIYRHWLEAESDEAFFKENGCTYI